MFPLEPKCLKEVVNAEEISSCFPAVSETESFLTYHIVFKNLAELGNLVLLGIIYSFQFKNRPHWAVS